MKKIITNLLFVLLLLGLPSMVVAGSFSSGESWKLTDAGGFSVKVKNLGSDIAATALLSINATASDPTYPVVQLATTTSSFFCVAAEAIASGETGWCAVDGFAPVAMADAVNNNGQWVYVSGPGVGNALALYAANATLVGQMAVNATGVVNLGQ